MPVDIAEEAAIARRRAVEIDEEATSLTDLIVTYINEYKSTGHQPSLPPRPKHEILVRAIDALQMLDLYIKVERGPYQG